MARWACPDSWPASSPRSRITTRPRESSKFARRRLRSASAAWVMRRSRQTSASRSGIAAAIASLTSAKLNSATVLPPLAVLGDSVRAARSACRSLRGLEASPPRRGILARRGEPQAARRAACARAGGGAAPRLGVDRARATARRALHARRDRPGPAVSVAQRAARRRAPGRAADEGLSRRGRAPAGALPRAALLSRDLGPDRARGAGRRRARAGRDTVGPARPRLPRVRPRPDLPALPDRSRSHRADRLLRRRELCALGRPLE